jgi:tetratricopeptide (TPR) repeat protein
MDPRFAQAHAGLGLMQVAIGDTAGARRSAERARALDPSLAEGAMLVGMIRQTVDKNWAGADSAFREAIRLNPNFAEAHHERSMLLMRLGEFDAAVQEGKLAVYQAPATARFEIGIGEVFVNAERYEDALAAVERTLALDSTYGVAHGIRSYVYSLQGDVERTRAALSKCDPRVCADFEHALLGYAHGIRGNRSEALRNVDTLMGRWKARGGESGAATGIAAIYAALGETESALEWLERGLEGGDFMLYTGIDPALKSLRGEPRFREVLKKLKLPEPR